MDTVSQIYHENIHYHIAIFIMKTKNSSEVIS